MPVTLRPFFDVAGLNVGLKIAVPDIATVTSSK
jgi:hypothetical protein